jgi:hypothetical protein
MQISTAVSSSDASTCSRDQVGRSAPCANGATCHDSLDDASIPAHAYQCVCLSGFANGACGYTDYLSQYAAQCTVATSAASVLSGNCDVDVDECASSPCVNGATCADSTDSAIIPAHAYKCTCAAGYANLMSVCAPCAPGRYQNASGLYACIRCRAGQYQNLTGSQACIDCEAGPACPAGRADSDTDSTTGCAQCVAGEYSAAGSILCATCQPGQHDHDSDPSSASARATSATGYSGQNCSGDVDSIYGSSTTAQLSLRTTHDAVLWITTTALVVCRDRAMDPSCRKALRHFVNVLHASVPLWHTGNLPDLVKSLTQPAESGNWTPLQEAQEADITTGITTPSDLVRVYVLEKMTTATRAAASQAIEGLLNMSSTNLCCAIQMAMHNLVVLPSFGPIPADWWDADKEEAEAAPTAIAADLFKPQTTWWLSSDSNIGSCLLWTFQLHDAHNRAEVLYEYFVDKLSSQVFRSTSQRVRDAAVQRWAEMGRDGQSTRTVACPLLTQAGVEPWQHLPCPELQAQTLCSATLVHVLEIVMAHEPALCDPGRYDRFPWARSTQQRPARSGEDLVLMLLYMQQQRLDSMPFSISGAFGVRLCVHLAGWRFAQAVEQSWNGNRTLDWYRHVRRLAEGAAREDELVSRLLYGRGHERDSSTIDLDWIDISWEPQRMKPAIEWLRRAPVTSALLCCSNDELDSLVYLGRFVQSWTEWPHGKKQTWSRAQESLTATQIAELHQDQLNSVVALLVERIDKDHCKDHCSVVFVRNGSSCKRFLLLDHIIPAGSPVLLDAGEVARYLRGCHAHYAAQTIAIVYFRHYNHILSDSSSCNSEYDSSSHNTGYTFSFNPSPQDMHQRECQLELAKNPVGSSPFSLMTTR